MILKNSQSYDQRTWEVETRGLIKKLILRHIEFKASLDYLETLTIFF